MKTCGRATKLERKTVEKNRRLYMKNLCFKLASLIPKDQYTISKDTLTQEDQLDQAASYVKKLKERVERLKQRKEMALRSRGPDNISGRVLSSFSLPVIDVRHLDSTLEVFIVSGLSKGIIFRDVLCVLEEEGAEAINASFSIAGDKIFCTIHSQAISSRIGFEAPRVCERLKRLVL
ncbi:transcription factor bHLH162 [Elaeis guineensis]|uniref:Transcription factor bHLH162 n=1 Tax=Elaeis guineensis var. tenera TaxID=51953 RepID=A0A6I9REU5_ELAGV|nr:transcription factor bHLH162 [Elaeis guineensis]